MSTEKDPTIVNEAEELELTRKVEDAADDDEAKKPTGEADGDDEDQAGDHDDDGEGDGDDKKERGDRRGKPAHKRIAEMRWQIGEKDRRIAELEAAQRGEKPSGDDKAAAPALADLKEPDPADYDLGENDPAYLRAAAVYDIKKELAEEQAQAAVEEQRTQTLDAIKGLDDNWATKAEAAVEKYPDFAETVLESAAAGDWKCGPVMSICISESDVGADVAYHLATHPEEAERIDKMHPMQQAMAFGRLEARFAAEREADGGEGGGERKPAAKIATDAPTPPKHTTRGGGGKFEVSDDTEDFGAFEAKHMAGKK